jgi:type IV pilus assembly protein PilC
MILQAIRYPLFVIMLFIIVFMFLIFKIIPEITAIYSDLGAELPWLTHQVVQLSSIFQERLLPVALTAFCLVILYVVLRRTLPMQVMEANLILRFPFLGKSIFFDALGRFCRSLSYLLKRKIPIETAVMLSSAAVDNIIAKRLAGHITYHVSQGHHLWEGMRSTRLFSATFVWMVKKAEERGDVEEVLLELSDFYDEKFDDMRQRANVLLEPIVIVMTGLLIGVFVIALYLPLFSLAGVLV